MGLAFLVVGLVLGIASSGDGLVPGDIAVARAIQWPAFPAIDAVARVVSHIGDDFPAMVLLVFLAAALLVVKGRHDLAVFVGLAAALRVIGPAAKRLVDSPRPSPDLVAVLDDAAGLGYPSGHALGAALFYGAIAIVASEVFASRVLVRAIQAIAVAMIVVTALSRVRLGVHWPTDVAGGVLIGLGLLCLLRAVGRRMRGGDLRT